MSGAHHGHPPLTTHRRLGHGAVLRSGRSRSYRAIEIGAGEPHLIRRAETIEDVKGPECLPEHLRLKTDAKSA